MKKIIVKYYSSRMLRTLDMNKMFEKLFDFAEPDLIILEPMSAAEKGNATENSGKMAFVRKRFEIHEQVAGGHVKRLEFLEQQIIEQGAK